MRSRVEKSDALVDRVARRIKETREGGMPRGERRPGEQGAQDRRQIDAGQPDDADATATRCSGNGNDRIAVGVHGSDKPNTSRLRSPPQHPPHGWQEDSENRLDTWTRSRVMASRSPRC